MEELIFKYLNKTLTQKENEQLKDWLESKEENKITLNKLASYYRNDESGLPMMKERVWDEINQRLGRSKGTLSSGWSLGWSNLFKIAAVFALVSAIMFVAYRYALEYDQQQKLIVNAVIKEAPLGTKVITRLPDGSRVTLNSGSKITYSDKFSTGDTREVSLTGEAFFEVEPNPQQPFLVYMNGDHVRVLGTSFNVRSYPEDSAVYVSVATGRVEYSIPDGEEVILEPDQMAAWLPTASKLSTGPVDRLQSFGWKDKVLYFKDATFDKMITEIERWYGVEISVGDDFGKRGTYSEEFKDPTLSEVLHSLSFVYRFQFKINGNKVILNKVTT